MSETSDWIIETSTSTFETDVIERSRELPVVVDFWAPWCGPCRQLTPVLEKLAVEFAGKFVLAKLNVDQAPEIAGAFGVQSIPFVAALSDGRLVDQFMGLLSEDQVRQFIQSLLPSPAEGLISQGRQVEESDPAAAERCYREAIELDPENHEPKIRLAHVLLVQQRDDDSRRLIVELEQRGYLEPEAERIKSQLALRSAAREAGGVDEAKQAAQANPDDLPLQLQLADALAVAGRHEEALEICLALVKKDKAGVGAQAKETMVKIFGVVGEGSPLTGEYRRKLASALY